MIIWKHKLRPSAKEVKAELVDSDNAILVLVIWDIDGVEHKAAQLWNVDDFHREDCLEYFQHFADEKVMPTKTGT